MEDEVKTFSDYLAIILRQKRLILMIVIGIVLVGVYVTYSMKPTYLSSATFHVQQQNISADIVQATGSGYVDEHIQLVRQRVMSVEILSGVIDKYELYPETTAGGTANRDAVEKLRLAVEFVPEYTDVINQRTGRSTMMTIGFDVFFEYSDPQNTQEVTAEIANLFLSENQRSRSAQVEETIAFLERDLESSMLEVEDATSALAVFREEHAGNLPNMSGFNLQAVQRTERAIEVLDADIRAARDRKLVLEGELADPSLLATAYDAQGEPIVGTAERLADLQRERLRLLSIYSSQHPDVINIEKEIEILASGISASGTSAADIQNQLNYARDELNMARQRYADDHPDVRRLARSIGSLEQQLDEALRQPVPSIRMASQDPVVRQLQLRIDAQEADIRTFQYRRAELVAKVADFERMQLQLPQIEREFAQLTRFSESAISRNTEIRQQLADAKTAGKLESEGGASFILTDPPRLPDKPFKPNRQSLLILTIVGALMIGIAVAIVVDSTDKTVKDARDVFRVSDTPPLAIIPFLETPRDFRKRVGENIAISGLILGCIALIVFIARSAA